MLAPAFAKKTMMKRTIFGRVAMLTALGILGAHNAFGADESMLKGLKWRGIGPFRGGRVSAVAGSMNQPGTFYIGLPQGGVWKTTSGGQTWYPVFDAIKETACVGSVAVAPSDSNIVYAGTGEASGGGEGWGLYKSSDAGKTWQHLGFEDTRMIPTILIDPKNPNIVLMAAEGNRKIQTDQRGVFRSTDGGKTWDHTLAIDNETGVGHMAWAYDHPEVIIAANQKRYSPTAGQPESKSKETPGIYKSTDEGKTWAKLDAKGLPRLFGRYTLAVAQNTNAQRMYVVGIFGLYRSDDGGANWRKMAANDPRIANGQGNYSSGVFVDTANPDIVYTVATCVYRSTDGGNTFEGFKGAPGGDDPHDMWIDPNNSSRILLGGDQGATVSFDAGATWGSWYNQATAQVYHIAVSNDFPYWVYATQQDSGVVSTSSRGNLGAITNLDWAPHPGFEFGYVTVDPINPKITYALGSSLGLAKFTFPNGQWVDCGPAPQAVGGLRNSVNIPIAFSTANPHELFAGYQFLMSTTDGGQHWKALSPDLAAKPDVKGTPTQGGRLGIITAFSECSANPKVIWVGSSNGLIHVTQDRGQTWTDVSMTSSGNVTSLDASHQEPGTAYASINTTQGKASVYRTKDFGKTWTPIINGFPTEEPFASLVAVIRADTKRKGLLFAGTASKVFVSFDDGDHWQSLMLNLPTTQMVDMVVHGDDLVLGTYGRGLWILDDINPLRQMRDSTASESAHLFQPGVGIRVRRNVNGDTPFPPEVPQAKNPPAGICLYYSLGSKPSGPISLDILDSSGKVVRHMSSRTPEPYADPAPEVPPFWVGKREVLSTEIGLNRTNWDIRYDNPPAFVHDVQDVMGANPGETPEAVEGPLALPGKYTARLTVDGKTYDTKFDVVNDPRSPASLRDLQEQRKVQSDIQDCIQTSWDGHAAVVAMRESLANKDIVDAAKSFDAKLSSLAGKVTYSRTLGSGVGNRSSNFVALNLALLQILATFDTGDAAPTDANWTSYASAANQTILLLTQWKELNGKPLETLNAVLTKNGIKAVPAGKTFANPPLPPAKYLIKPKAPAVGTGHALPPDEDGDGDE